jgi:hypothetical protein
VLLNVFDVDTTTGERSVELQVGDLPFLGLDADLLVVSAFEGHYKPVPGTLLGRLWEAYGLRLRDLEIALDLRSSPLRSWVSAPLDLPESGAVQCRFRRLAVIEGAMTFEPGDLLPWPPFNRLFSLLALLPMRRIACKTVASPLLGSGNQGIQPVAHYPDLLEAYRMAFQHVPELQRLILFDRTAEHLSLLGEAIDSALGRRTTQQTRLPWPSTLPGFEDMECVLRQWSHSGPPGSDGLSHDINELLMVLRSQEVSPIVLGIHARRVVEGLVLRRLAGESDVHRLDLNRGIRRLGEQGADRWLISCLHQVRCFGNWMVHPSIDDSLRPVKLHDVLAMLSALQRVLEDYPW